MTNQTTAQVADCGYPELPEPFMELHRDLGAHVYDAWATQMRAYVDLDRSSRLNGGGAEINELRDQIKNLERIKNDLNTRLFKALETDATLKAALHEVDHVSGGMLSRSLYSDVLDIACVHIARVKELEAATQASPILPIDHVQWPKLPGYTDKIDAAAPQLPAPEGVSDEQPRIAT